MSLNFNSATYNHRLVEVTAFVSHGFEDFTLYEFDCHSLEAVWLEYGGRLNSGTIYCCGGTSNRQRRKPLKIEGLTIPLTEDEHFRQFDRLIHPEPGSDTGSAVFRTTIVGRYFAGQKTTAPAEEA